MKSSENLWGGRFTGKLDKTFAEFNNSFGFDKRLFAADVRASIAHAEGLFGARVLTRREADKIKKGLSTLLKHADSDKNYFDGDASEDVHSFIEKKLIELVGDAGRKVHAGRSRNDQVATAFRLWLREEIDEIAAAARDLQKAIVAAAERHRNAIMPGYTHLQKAQPILWAHWCLAYYEMLARDQERLSEVRRRTNILPLGSAALAGTSYPIDREAVARELGFYGVTANSLDAVSDRDFAVEFVGACSLTMVHLSRLAEDVIVYCSNEFGFLELSDAVSTGSSIMPQKKNADAMELIRGKAGRIFGHHAALLATMKGLPLAYNKDMQEDKEAVFDTVDNVKMCLRVAAIVLENLSLNETRSFESALHGYLNATELADYLVRKGVPFRTAHDTAGKAVLYAIGQGRELDKLELGELRQFSTKIEADVFRALSLEQTLSTKGQIGGTSPVRVFKALSKAKRALRKEEKN